MTETPTDTEIMDYLREHYPNLTESMIAVVLDGGGLSPIPVFTLFSNLMVDNAAAVTEHMKELGMPDEMAETHPFEAACVNTRTLALLAKVPDYEIIAGLPKAREAAEMLWASIQGAKSKYDTEFAESMMNDPSEMDFDKAISEMLDKMFKGKSHG